MKIAIIGCGVMGGAFARQFVQKGHDLVLCDHSSKKGEALVQEIGGTYVSDLKEAAKGADLVLLAIKPKDLESTAKEIGPLKGQILLSILSGATVDLLKEYFPGASVIRSMPNLALTCGESVIALVKDSSLPEGDKDQIDQLLEGLGLILWVEEEKINAITALAGSGPAFIFVIIEAMVESGIVLGLRADEALDLTLQTLIGAVALQKANLGHPGALRWQISSPGGTTIAGLKALEESGVRAGIMKTILATFQRTQEML